jgi:hypothetical protein
MDVLSSTLQEEHAVCLASPWQIHPSIEDEG